MSTMSHGASPVPEKRGWARRLSVPDMWASLAIIVMWLAVLADALWGPDFVSTSASSMTKIPSAIVLALFAWLGTKAVAKYGFGDRRERDD
jgi:hypothetical protein